MREKVTRRNTNSLDYKVLVLSRILMDELRPIIKPTLHTPTLKKKKYVSSASEERTYIELETNQRKYITLK